MGGRGTATFRRDGGGTGILRREPDAAVDYTAIKTGGAGGSNEGGFYTGSDGVERYVKFYKDEGQAYAEHLSNTIYRDLGLAAPDSAIFTGADGRVGFASVIIKDTKPLTVNAKNADKIIDGFAADVLTSNRDVIGLVNDNILVQRGNIVRVDNGGTFMFRAMGSRKTAPELTSIGEYEGFFSSTQYKPVLNAAGIKNSSQIKTRAAAQIRQIKTLEKKAGGWSKYVNNLFPKWNSQDKSTMITMLDTRSKALYNIAR